MKGNVNIEQAFFLFYIINICFINQRREIIHKIGIGKFKW
jgi:hypothetical protein